MVVQPGSLVGVDGQKLSGGQVGISTVPPELVKDMLPPGLLQHTFDITIQAPGVATFSTPAQMTFPNVFGAAPGTKLDFLSFDHTTGMLAIDGKTTVSADGLTATTDPGSGITHPGWHGLTPPGVTASGGWISDANAAEDAPKQAPNLHTDENGNPLPDGVVRQNSAVRLGDVDPTLTDELPNLRDVYRSELGESDYDLTVTSGHRDGDGKSRHDNNTAVDLGTRYSDGDQFDRADFDKVGKDLRDRIKQDLGKDARIGARYPDGTKPDWADFLDPNPYHYHVDLGRKSTFVPVQPKDPPSSVPPAPFVPDYGRITDDAGTLDVRFSVRQGGTFDPVFLPPNALLTLRLYDSRDKTFLERTFWTGSSGGTVSPLRPAAGLQGFAAYVAASDPAAAAEGEDLSVDPEPLEYVIATQDSDHDGLPDLGEGVIGSDPHRADTNGDGVTDGAAVDAGQDPLRGLALATGVVANLPLQGQARAVLEDAAAR